MCKKKKNHLIVQYEVGKKKEGERRILPLFSFLQKPLQWFPSSYWQICSTNQQQMLPLSVYNHWHMKRLKNIPTQICTASSKKIIITSTNLHQDSQEAFVGDLFLDRLLIQQRSWRIPSQQASKCSPPV